MTWTRRLAAILAAKVVACLRMIERDEEGTLTWLRQLRQNIIEPSIANHGGRLFKTTGDGFLAEFASPVEAVRCAIAIQEEIGRDRQAHGTDGVVKSFE